MLVFDDSQLYTFPRDPERRVFTVEDLFRVAAVRVIKRDGLGPDDDLMVADVVDVMNAAFENGTVVPVGNMN